MRGHSGIYGNEMADSAAKAALSSSIAVQTPLPGQPKVPLSVARAWVKGCVGLRWRDRWVRNERGQLGVDRLSRLRRRVCFWGVVCCGRREQVVMPSS